MTPEEAVTELLATGAITDHRIAVKLLFEAVKATETRRAAGVARDMPPGATRDETAREILTTGGLEAEE